MLFLDSSIVAGWPSMKTCISTPLTSIFFFFNDTATTEIYTLSLHDALPIWRVAPLQRRYDQDRPRLHHASRHRRRQGADAGPSEDRPDLRCGGHHRGS